MEFPDMTPIFWIAVVAVGMIIFGAIGWGLSFIGPWWLTPVVAVIGGIIGCLLFRTVK